MSKEAVINVPQMISCHNVPSDETSHINEFKQKVLIENNLNKIFPYFQYRYIKLYKQIIQ